MGKQENEELIRNNQYFNAQNDNQHRYPFLEALKNKTIPYFIEPFSEIEGETVYSCFAQNLDGKITRVFFSASENGFKQYNSEKIGKEVKVNTHKFVMRATLDHFILRVFKLNQMHFPIEIQHAIESKNLNYFKTVLSLAFESGTLIGYLDAFVKFAKSNGNEEIMAAFKAELEKRGLLTKEIEDEYFKVRKAYSAEVVPARQQKLQVSEEPIHGKITPSDLEASREGFLLTQEETTFMNKYLIEKPDFRKASRKRNKILTLADGSEMDLRYSVIVLEDQQGIKEPYVLYRGGEHSLGAGGFGQVKLAQNMNTGEWIALKVQISSSDSMLPVPEKKGARSEYERLPYAVKKEADAEFKRKGKGVLFRQSRKIDKFGNFYIENKAYLGIELGKGANLHTYLKNNKPEIFKAIDISILAAEYLLEEFHKKGEIHRDLKSTNILYYPKSKDKSKALRIIDLGGLRLLDEQGLYRTNNMLHTPGYLAPETELSNEGMHLYSKASDIYALGKMFQKDILNNIAPGSSKQAKRELETLANKMTNADPGLRPDAEKVISELKRIREKYYPKEISLQAGIATKKKWFQRGRQALPQPQQKPEPKKPGF